MDTNDRLRAAMIATATTVDTLAERAQVDPKTVARWLRGRTPHSRNRIVVGGLVNQDPLYLWPETDDGTMPGSLSDSEVIATYARRSLTTPDLWNQLINGATRRIDMLGYAMHHVPEQHPNMFSAAQAIAESGGRVRIVLADPDGDSAAGRDQEEQLDGGLLSRIRSSAKYLAEHLPNDPAIEVRCQDAPMYNSIFRFDDEALVTPHLYGRPGWQSPCLHVRRLGPSGVFENYMQHFEDIWDHARPMEHR